MQKTNDNIGYTRRILAEVADYNHTAEYVVIRELCAIYDHFCDCVAVVEQRLYVQRRIEHYKDILKNERNAK